MGWGGRATAESKKQAALSEAKDYGIRGKEHALGGCPKNGTIITLDNYTWCQMYKKVDELLAVENNEAYGKVVDKFYALNVIADNGTRKKPNIQESP